jgi:8-oxo-dGTP pyrophosphatase MutT (NUDIX family)
MGHPAGVTNLPDRRLAALAPAVESISLTYGAEPHELAALLRGQPGRRAGQLAAIAWVLDASGSRILLVEHRTFGWSCPGGHVEAAELPVETAIRELAEETGLLLSPADADPVTLTLDDVPGDEHGPAHLHWILGYRFVGDPLSPLVVERDRIAWHRVDELPRPAVADLAPLLSGLVRGR